MLLTFWGNVSGISLPSNEANGLLNLLSVPTISSCDGGAGAAATATIGDGRINEGISILPAGAFLATEAASHVALFVGCSSFLLSPPPETLTAPRELRLASAEAAARTNSSRGSLPFPLTPPLVVGLLVAE